MTVSKMILGLIPAALFVVGCGQKNPENTTEAQGEITKYQSGWINKKNNVEMFFALSQSGNTDRVCFYSAKHDQNVKDSNGKLLAPKSDLEILKSSKVIASEFVSVGLLNKALSALTTATAAEIVRVSKEQSQCNYMSRYLTPREYNLYTGMYVNGTRPDLFTSVRDCKNYVTKRVQKVVNDPDTGALVTKWVNEQVFDGSYDDYCVEQQIVVLCQADKRVQIESFNNTLSSFKGSVDLISTQSKLATSASNPVSLAMLTTTQGVSTSNVSSALARLKAESLTAKAFGGTCVAPKF